MVNMRPSDQVAPGSLEEVRVLLNTWLIPNDTRSAEDHLEEYARERGLAAPDRAVLRRVRDDLRHAVEGIVDADDVLNRWIDRLGVQPHVARGELTFRHDGELAGHLIAACVAAVAAGRWRRLKACPDCRWVFYDHTRNAGKRWCVMTASGPDGRSCGSIAKVRAYRERARKRP